jgi:7,8-dihydropterin-6-yl-methyl-4-(beta-D-ribofuranosyl)aminobenzene 5'-phosphate synthase
MRNKFNLVVLADNRKLDESLESEHGLCVFLDTGTTKILLDTGASDLFIRNAERLEIDLTEIDYVFISHGHADHIGGLLPFLTINSKAKVLISEQALNQRFFSTRNGVKEIGNLLNLEPFRNRFLMIDQVTHLGGDLSVFHSESNLFSNPKANSTLFKDAGNGLVVDDFDHELVFCAGKEDVFVFTGCGHRGLLNILYTVERECGNTPGVVFGGFHLLDCQLGQDFEHEEDILQIGGFLNDHYPNTQFYTGHCTGSVAMELLKNKQIQSFYTGLTTLL